MTMEETPFSLRASVFSVLKTLCVKAAQNKLDLIYDVDPRIPDHLIGDPFRLKQIITNLVGNAVKFTSQGQVALTARLVDVEDDVAEIVFCVADTGIGIKPDKLDLIFDTFAQADGSTTRKYGGTGLGLSISRKLVALMNGRLWVNSDYGRGSQFFFTTKAEVTEMPASAVMDKMAPFAGRSVLFVDTLGDTTGIPQAIEQLHLKPIVISNVEGVWSTPKSADTKLPFDTVIVDNLKDAEKLREIEHLRYIPIILLAPTVKPKNSLPPFIHLTDNRRRLLNLATSQDEVLPPIPVKSCLDMGVTSYCTTPTSLQELSGALLPALESHTALPTDQSKEVQLDILLAEDNKVNQKLAVRLLENCGHSVEIADNGQIAVDLFKARINAGHPYDIILVSLRSP